MPKMKFFALRCRNQSDGVQLERYITWVGYTRTLHGKIHYIHAHTRARANVNSFLRPYNKDSPRQRDHKLKLEKIIDISDNMYSGLEN